MKNVFVPADLTKRRLFSLLAAGVIFAVAGLSNQFRSAAANDGENQSKPANNFRNYDVRTDKTAAATLANFRVRFGKNESNIAAARQTLFAGAAELKRRVPTLKVEYNNDLRVAEVIAPDPAQSFAALTGASSAKRSEILRNFLKNNNDLIGVSDTQADNLKVAAEYANPNGNLSFAQLDQFVGGIPVFNGTVKAGFTKNGEMFRVINNLAPALDESAVSSDFGTVDAAVQAAFNYVSRPLKAEDLQFNAAASSENKVKFGTGDFATVAEKFYFPTEPGVIRPAWQILEWEDKAAFLLVVDAETKTLLWRKNISNDQTQPATYNIYNDDSPQPFTPGPTAPNGAQGTPISRTNMTLVGNEPPNAFNNLGWITDGNNTTNGNNVEAGVDRVTPNGIDNVVTGSGNRQFIFNYTPDISTTTGGDALGADYQNGVVTNLFYWNNVYHDRLYRAGFTEAAGNFQNDNFGRGGAGNDRVSAEAQDYSGTNNANMATPPDGYRPRMQMYIFPGGAALRDGDLDNEVMLHEATHGVSNRLHGNGSGLLTDMAASMGEGWSDFYARTILATADEPLDGVYTTGAYVTYKIGSNIGLGTFVNNGFYGIRRFPYVLKSITGGANNRPLNPLTFRDIDPAQQDLTRGAYPKSSIIGSSATEVHNAGEVWCMTLMEVRARLIQRLGFSAGTAKTLQIVTDGMKLAPVNPTFLQERDAILAGARAGGTIADVEDIWQGFAVRGMGFSARINNPVGNVVVESFDLPNAVPTQNISLSDASGNNNGYPEPGETITLNVPLTNTTGITLTNAALQIVGGNTIAYGDLANGQTAVRQITYAIPANASCGGYLTLNFNVNSNFNGFARQTAYSRQILIGAPQFTGGATQNFDAVTAPALPIGWEKAQNGNTTGYVTTAVSPVVSAPNALFVPDPATVTYAETATQIRVTSAAAQIAFKLNYNTELTWDGTVLEIKIGSGEWQDITAAGGSFVSGGYSDIISENAGHELSGRAAWTGNSGGYINVLANLPAAANNQTVGLRFRAGSDLSVGGTGTRIDNLVLTGGSLIGGYNCSTSNLSAKSRVDYDGDGQSDIAVFRQGNWYELLNQTDFTAAQFGSPSDKPLAGDIDGDGKTDLITERISDGSATFYILNSQNKNFSVVQWGLASDIPVIGDYNGDGKDDIAVYRPSNGFWYILPTGGGSPIFISFGAVGDKAVPGDYDGDGKTDAAVYRPSNGTWYLLQSQSGFAAVQFGLSGDKLVPADYDNDNKEDIAVYREGMWYMLLSSNGKFAAYNYGLANDLPVPADYDGDGADEVAVYRDGNWYILSANGNATKIVSFGQAGDVPIQSVFTR